jgi:hypothetical protein
LPARPPRSEAAFRFRVSVDSHLRTSGPPQEREIASEFDLAGIVPCGRRFHEYCAFFDLGELRVGDSGRILDVGGGPSSFTAEAAAKGLSAVAVDPLYAFPGEAIRARFDVTRTKMIEGVGRARDRFIWTYYGSPAALEQLRRTALDIFLDDYASGRSSGRYVVGSLPTLPFADASFGLPLCSHLLFLYSDELDLAFHVAAILELLRVADEVRVFPLLDLAGQGSSHVAGVIGALQEQGFRPELAPVPFEFQLGRGRCYACNRLVAASDRRCGRESTELGNGASPLVRTCI